MKCIINNKKDELKQDRELEGFYAVNVPFKVDTVKNLNKLQGLYYGIHKNAMKFTKSIKREELENDNSFHGFKCCKMIGYVADVKYAYNYYQKKETVSAILISCPRVVTKDGIKIVDSHFWLFFKQIDQFVRNPITNLCIGDEIKFLAQIGTYTKKNGERKKGPIKWILVEAEMVYYYKGKRYTVSNTLRIQAKARVGIMHYYKNHAFLELTEKSKMEQSLKFISNCSGFMKRTEEAFFAAK